MLPAVLRNHINLHQAAWRHITGCNTLHNHCRRDLPWPWQMVAKFEADAKRENVSHEFNLTRCMKIRCSLKILIWNLINSPQPYWLHIGLNEVDLYVLHHTAFVHLIEFFFACLHYETWHERSGTFPAIPNVLVIAVWIEWLVTEAVSL